jgi:hypothetical protein
LKKIIVIVPVIIAIVGLVIILNSDDKETDKTVFHVTLAEPKMYQNGIYSEEFSLNPGKYFFRFIPNGDSPETLSIELTGKDFNFNEEFRLKGTLHETGISQYYTWDYDGQKEIEIVEQQEIIIKINPNGNVLGSVSVDIVEN